MRPLIVAFLSCFQIAFATFQHEGVEWKEISSDVMQVIAEPGSVIDFDTFHLEAGKRLEVISSDVTIKSMRGIEIEGEIISDGNLVLNSEGGSLILKGHLSSPKGSIQLIGERISLEDDASLNVSSERGGGTISMDAKRVYIGRDAMIYANGLEESNAGEISIRSDEETIFLGRVYACSEGAGKGGQVEVSGKEGFIFNGEVFHSSRSGENGMLLIDPKFAYIQSGGTDPATGNTFSSSPSATVSISGSSLQTALNAGNVTIEANTDISFDDNVTVTTAGNGLSLRAGRSVSFSESLTLNNAPLTILINDENAESSERETGSPVFTLMDGVEISTQGGNVTVSLGTFGGSQMGQIVIDSAEIHAAGGDISLTGVGTDTRVAGIVISGSSQLTTTGNGTITLNGTGSSQPINAFGIQCAGNQGSPMTFLTENGAISLTGTGGDDVSGQMNCGLDLINVNLETTGTGPINLSGTSGLGMKNNAGVVLSGTDTKITTSSGAIVINGIGKGTGGRNSGICLESGPQIVSNGAGTITLDGTGGSGTDCNFGLIFSSYSSPISIISSSGDISLTGVANGSGRLNQGICLEKEVLIQSTDTAKITLNGTGAFGTSSDSGVTVFGANTFITNVNGDIDITGTAHGTGVHNEDIYIQYPNNIYTTGSGIISFTPHLGF